MGLTGSNIIKTSLNFEAMIVDLANSLSNPANSGQDTSFTCLFSSDNHPVNSLNPANSGQDASFTCFFLINFILLIP